MRRAYVFRLRPTARQHVKLTTCLDAHRELYNAALEERRGAWSHNRTRVCFAGQCSQLTEMRSVRADQAVWSYSSQQATLRRLNKAFDGFFRRVKAGEKAGYPRFRGKYRFDSVLWPKDGDGARWLPDANRVYLQGIGQLKATVHRPVLGRVKTIQVKRQGRKWMLVLSCDDVPANPLPATGCDVGVDVGVAAYATLSDSTTIENPRWSRAASAKLVEAQRRLQRSKRGSRSRADRRETVGTRHRKIANRRKDFHHKHARALVARYDLIVVEDLKIANMLRRAKPKPDANSPGQFLPNRARAKSGLNRSISDAGWGQFVSILRAKAEDAGRTWIEVNPRHTSDGCECCGYAAPDNRVSQAKFACRKCGHTAPADEHAARNILRAGLALNAASAALKKPDVSSDRRSHQEQAHA